MPELALQNFAQSSEIGQLPNVNKSASSLGLKIDSTGDQDRLFAAILKALVLLGNKPSFPQEVASCIVKYKLAPLGESNPHRAVSDCITRYFKRASEIRSAIPLLITKVEDQKSPADVKYCLPYCPNPSSLKGGHSSFNSFSNKRPSAVVALPNKKVKTVSLDESEMLAPLPLEEDWLSDTTQSFDSGSFDLGSNTFEFDTIVPIECEGSVTSATLNNPSSISYESDTLTDDHSDTESKSDSESFDSESEVEQADFCEDMMNGDLDFNLASDSSINCEHENEFFVSLSDQDFHSDSSHSSAESGTSTASPLLTPEPSPRRGSEAVDAIQSSVYDDSFIEHWQSHSIHDKISMDPTGGAKADSILPVNLLPIPELDELLGIREIDVDTEGSIIKPEFVSISNAPKKPIKQIEDNTSTGQNVPKHTPQILGDSIIKDAKLVDGSVVPCIEDEVSSFLYLDEDEEKILPSAISQIRKEVLPKITSDKYFQPGVTSVPTLKSNSKNLKQKNRNSTTTEYNPSMLIPSTLPIYPQICITMVESLPFYVTTVGPAEGFANTYQLLRRYDSGYVNATTLLTAGGMESEKEQAIVLSLEIRRIRIRRRESSLFGTWIPLQRARALAATCSLQQKLGSFLDYDLSSFFPSQLPPHIAAFNPAQVSSRLHQFIRTRAASLKPRDNYVANIGIAPRCLHPTSKSFFSGVGHQLNQILGLQSKQLKSYSALGDNANSRRASKSKPNTDQSEDTQDDSYSLIDFENIDTFMEDVDFDIDEGDVNFL